MSRPPLVRSILSLAVAAATGVGISIVGAQTAHAEPIDTLITNPALRSCVMEALGNPSSAPDQTDPAVTGLTSLSCDSRGIAWVNGLEAFTGLTSLSLAGNAIADLNPLASMTGLTSLDLSGNAIADLSPLGALDAVTDLNLSGNTPLEDLAPLANLASLTVLDLSQISPFEDLGPLSALTGLSELNLSGNSPLRDLAPLASLTALTRLNLADNEIEDLAPLSALSELRILDLSDNLIADTEPLAPLKLTNLSLDRNLLLNVYPAPFWRAPASVSAIGQNGGELSATSGVALEIPGPISDFDGAQLFVSGLTCTDPATTATGLGSSTVTISLGAGNLAGDLCQLTWANEANTFAGAFSVTVAAADDAGAPPEGGATPPGGGGDTALGGDSAGGGDTPDGTNTPGLAATGPGPMRSLGQIALLLLVVGAATITVTRRRGAATRG